MTKMTPARSHRAVRPYLHPGGTRPARCAGARRHLPRPPGRPCDRPRTPARRRSRHPQRRERLPPAVIDDIAYLAYLAVLAEQLCGGQSAAGHALRSRGRPPHAIRAFSPTPASGIRPTGLPQAALDASAVAGPRTTVRADVERLLTSPLLSLKASVSGKVYEIATGRVSSTHGARYL